MNQTDRLVCAAILSVSEAELTGCGKLSEHDLAGSLIQRKESHRLLKTQTQSRHL